MDQPDTTNLEGELSRAVARARHPKVAPMLEGLVSPKLRSSWGVGAAEFFGPARAFYQPVPFGSAGTDINIADTSTGTGAAFALIVGLIEGGDLVDLAAVKLPGQHVATRRGIGVALGSDSIAHAREFGGTLRLHETPIAWLKDPEAAACLIDWSVAAFTLADLDRPMDELADTPRVVIPSVRYGQRLAAALRRPVLLPKMLLEVDA